MINKSNKSFKWITLSVICLILLIITNLDGINLPAGKLSEVLEQVSEDLKKEILKTIKEYSKKSPQEIKEERYQKFRNMGEYQII